MARAEFNLRQYREGAVARGAFPAVRIKCDRAARSGRVSFRRGGSRGARYSAAPREHVARRVKSPIYYEYLVPRLIGARVARRDLPPCRKRREGAS